MYSYVHRRGQSGVCRTHVVGDKNFAYRHASLCILQVTTFVNTTLFTDWYKREFSH